MQLPDGDASHHVIALMFLEIVSVVGTQLAAADDALTRDNFKGALRLRIKYAI